MINDKRIKELKNKVIHGKRKCVWFSVLDDDSVVFAINGNMKTEINNLKMCEEEIKKILGFNSRVAHITDSFSLFDSINRNDKICKVYEDLFYKNLNEYGYSEINYFNNRTYIHYNYVDCDGTGNFNCVERKLLGSDDNIKSIYVSINPCYFCLAAFRQNIVVNYLERKTFYINKMKRINYHYYKLWF